jgi:hypothetical protein
MELDGLELDALARRLQSTNDVRFGLHIHGDGCVDGF